MKKYMPTLVIFLLIIPFILVNTRAEVLIQIEEGDSWTYTITDPSSKVVSFEVVSYDYFGNDEDLIRVNKIEANESLELIKLNSLLSVPFYVNLSRGWDIADADLVYSFGEIISDEVWNTARGNLPYERTTVINTTLSFSNIDYNETNYPDCQHNAILTFHETMSNPTIIEPLSTGTVKLNIKLLTITGVIENTDFLGLGIVEADIAMMIIIAVEERYEASDHFEYMETECRNLTIRPLSTNIRETRFCDVEQQYFSFMFSDYVEVSVDALEPIENWIYSFDAGLPLLVTETEQSVASSRNNAVIEEDSETLRVMKLVDINLVNSNFEFPTEPGTTSTNMLFISILSGLFLTLVVTRRLRKKN